MRVRDEKKACIVLACSHSCVRVVAALTLNTHLENTRALLRHTFALNHGLSRKEDERLRLMGSKRLHGQHHVWSVFQENLAAKMREAMGREQGVGRRTC